MGSWPWTARPNFVLRNGVNPTDYAMDSPEARRIVRRLVPQLGESPYVLFLGRLDPKKRLDLLLAAFLGGAPPEFKLVVAGPDAHGLWPRMAGRYVTGAGAAARVCRVGTVTGRAKVALLAAASLFALPSEHENFGLAALESLAAGTPVLLSPRVDLAGPVASARLGRTAPLDPASWRSEFTRLRSSTPDRCEATERRQHWVREHYAWGPIAAELVDRYRSIVAGCSPEIVRGTEAPRFAEAVAR